MSLPLKERYTRTRTLQRKGRQQGADESVLLASWGISALATCEQIALSSPATGGSVFKRALIDGLPLQKGPRESSGTARRGRNTDAIPAWPATPPPAVRRGRLQACLDRPIDIAEAVQGGSPAASVARYANSGQFGRGPSPQTPGQSDFIAPVWMRIPDCTQKRRGATGIENRPRPLTGSFLRR